MKQRLATKKLHCREVDSEHQTFESVLFYVQLDGRLHRSKVKVFLFCEKMPVSSRLTWHQRWQTHSEESEPQVNLRLLRTASCTNPQRILFRPCTSRIYCFLGYLSSHLNSSFLLSLKLTVFSQSYSLWTDGCSSELTTKKCLCHLVFSVTRENSQSNSQLKVMNWTK